MVSPPENWHGSSRPADMLRRGEAPLARATATLHQPFCSLTIAQPRDFGAGRLPRRPAAARHGAKNAPIAARETRVRCSANAAQEAETELPRGHLLISQEWKHQPSTRRRLARDASHSSCFCCRIPEANCTTASGRGRRRGGRSRSCKKGRRCRRQNFKIPRGNLFHVQACSFKLFR